MKTSRPCAVGTVIASLAEPLSGTVALDTDVYFGPIEPWVLAPEVAKDLDFKARQEFLSETRYALFWNGPSHVLSDDPDRLFALANLAVWLARPGDFRVRVIVTFEQSGSSRGSRQVSWGNALWLHPEYARTRLSCSDIEAASALFTVLRSIHGQGTLSTSIWMLWTALCQKAWIHRYLFSWIAVEALLGPEDGREITFRLAQRGAWFLGNSVQEREHLFAFLKEGYAWRSKVVHGLKLHKLGSEESGKLQYETEMVARRCLLKILPSEQLRKVFDTKGREQHLDRLILGC